MTHNKKIRIEIASSFLFSCFSFVSSLRNLIFAATDAEFNSLNSTWFSYLEARRINETRSAKSNLKITSMSRREHDQAARVWTGEGLQSWDVQRHHIAMTTPRTARARLPRISSTISESYPKVSGTGQKESLGTYVRRTWAHAFRGREIVIDWRKGNDNDSSLRRSQIETGTPEDATDADFFYYQKKYAKLLKRKGRQEISRKNELRSTKKLQEYAIK